MFTFDHVSVLKKAITKSGYLMVRTKKIPPTITTMEEDDNTITAMLSAKWDKFLQSDGHEPEVYNIYLRL